MSCEIPSADGGIELGMSGGDQIAPPCGLGSEAHLKDEGGDAAEWLQKDTDLGESSELIRPPAFFNGECVDGVNSPRSQISPLFSPKNKIPNFNPLGPAVQNGCNHFNMPYIQPATRIQESELPIRGPQRSWRQCVENEQINDQVRRPLARICHKRETPLIISREHFENLKFKTIEREMRQREVERCREMVENQRRAAHQRKADWNYTVDSLLERKRWIEAEKVRREEEADRNLLDEIREGKREQDKEVLSKAKKQMLYRKGLIRDFHSAMAYSKMMQDIEAERKNLQTEVSPEKESNQSSSSSLWDKRSIKRLIYQIRAPELKPNGAAKSKAPLNPKYVELIKRDESRVQERQKEIQKEVDEAQTLRVEACPEGWADIYKDPEAEESEDVKKKLLLKKKAQDMLQRLEEMQNKRLVQGFMESHEREVDRQADEFNKHKDMMRDHERKLIQGKIEDKVKKSQKCAEVLAVELRNTYQRKDKLSEGNTNENYALLREEWEQNWMDKIQEEKDALDMRRERAREDYIRRQHEAERKRLTEEESSREYAHNRLLAQKKITEGDRERGELLKSRELAQFHLAQMEERKSRKDMETAMENAWAQRMDRVYEEELDEMKSYANNCISDWKSKGRDVRPMLASIKKWDCDSPHNQKCSHGAPAHLCACRFGKDEGNSHKYQNVKRGSVQYYESTAMRLGFGNSGT